MAQPDAFTLMYIMAGGLFVLMALTGSYIKRLPLSTAVIYLVVGYAIGPSGMDLLKLNPVTNWKILERLTEIAVVVSLFTAGLKLKPHLNEPAWRPALVLASLGMAMTVAMVTLVGWLALGLSLGAAVLLGAILAPTDPVLASDVQAQKPGDRDRVRFTLTGEAGLNDGTAFPFVMLGLGLLGLHEIGAGGWRWIAVDVVWAVSAGLGVGAVLGSVVARLVLFLRREHKEAVGLDDFLTLGLIALSYGVALYIHAYGFLAVFAAGLALRHEELRGENREEKQPAPRRETHVVGEVADARPEGDATRLASADRRDAWTEEDAIIGDMPDTSADNKALLPASETDPAHASAYMAKKVLEFNETLERVAEVALVLIVGSMISTRLLTWHALGLVVFLFIVARPLMAWICLLRSNASHYQLRLIAWFGIRGVGSVYYLTYALGRGVTDSEGEQLSDLVLAVIAASIVLHGITVTPAMKHYQERFRHRRRKSDTAQVTRMAQ